MASKSTEIEKVNKATMKLNTGKDKLNNLIMMADTSVSWDQFISSAPNSIAILGQLMLLSCKKDFSLEAAKPEGGFKYLNFPKSFRATLVQASGAGFKAFNTTDVNMLEIMILTSNVSENIRNVTKCLVIGTPEDIDTTMPLILKKVDRVATECATLSREIVKSFEYAGDLLTEIYQTCLVRDTQNEQELDKQKLMTQDFERSKLHVKEQLDNAEEEYTELEEKLKSAESEYTKAIDSMPSGGKIAAISIANTLVSSTCNLLQVIGPGVVGYALGGPVVSALAGVGSVAITIKNTSSYSNATPGEYSKATPQNAIDSWKQNSQFKVEQTKQNLEQMRNLKKEQNKIKQEAQDKFLKTLRELEKANAEERNLDEIKNIFEEGIRTMANSKEKWNLLTNFFTRISAIIRATISVSLKDFKELAEVEAKHKLESETYTLTEFKKDTIFQNAFTACATAYFVNTIAKTYNDVSQSYLMGPLSALDKLVTNNPVKDKDEINFQSIINQCLKAQDYIKKMVEKSCKETEDYSEQRMRQIEMELGSILPPLEQEEILLIKQETSKAAEQENTTNSNMDYESFSF